MIDNFIKLLCLETPLSTDIIEYLKKNLRVQKLQKNTVLVPDGHRSDKLYFVYEGMVRFFYYENDEEITSQIAAENDFVYSSFSFLSNEAIELLETSILFSINRHELEVFNKHFGEGIFFLLKITEKNLFRNETWVRLLRLPANQRLEKFFHLYPNIAPRIKVQHLASFLGLSRSHVSHLRGRKL